MARTVLIADDSPTITRKVEGILRGEGLDVKTVSNGVAAIKKLSSLKPHLVLADVAMPGKDGYEVCDFLKNSPDLRHVPVLLVYSEAEPYDEQRGARVRADGRIKKPFDPEELISTVAKFLTQSEAAVPKPQTAPTVIMPPPSELSAVPEPMDEEPKFASKIESSNLAALSEGVAFAEPGLEEIPAPPPGPGPPPAEPRMGAGFASWPAPAGALAEATAQVPAEPLPTEKSPAAREPAPEPAFEGTMMFRLPADISEPVMSDEWASAPSLAEAPEGPPVSATTLESFSLTEAATGQVRFAPSEAEVEPGAEPVVAPPEAPVQGEAAPEAEPFAGAPQGGEGSAISPGVVVAPPVDANFVYLVVQKVVVRMSPPALAPEVIHDLAMRLTTEIIVELNQESSSNQ